MASPVMLNNKQPQVLSGLQLSFVFLAVGLQVRWTFLLQGIVGACVSYSRTYYCMGSPSMMGDRRIRAQAKTHRYVSSLEPDKA